MTADRAWIGLTTEDPVDPLRRIVDAHHHLYGTGDGTYLLDDLLSDTTAGHNVTHTVVVEGGRGHRRDGPAALRPVGETELAAAQAQASDRCPTRIAALVPMADLSLGDAVDEVLDAHERAAGGRLRGIRHATGWDPSGHVPSGHTRPRPGLMAEPGFRRGVERLGERGYSFDAWLYHPQLPQLADLAAAVDGTTVIVDHLGGPLNVGPYRDRDAVRLVWRSGMEQLAARPNVVVKLGGIGMDRRFFGTGWSSWPRPPRSDDVVAWWGDDIRWCIDTFGPSRCMFESNYPVDRQSLGYTVLWNAFQKIAAGYSDAEQNALFADTATRVYRIAR